MHRSTEPFYPALIVEVAEKGGAMKVPLVPPPDQSGRSSGVGYDIAHAAATFEIGDESYFVCSFEQVSDASYPPTRLQDNQKGQIVGELKT